MKLTTLSLISGLLASFSLAAAPPIPNLLDATVVVSNATIPFRFEIQDKNGNISGSFFNGDEKVTSTAGSRTGDKITLEFAHYATRLEATWDGTTLSGTYGRTGRPPYPFSARAYTAPTEADSNAPSIAGLWEVPVKSPKGESAWKFIVRQSGPEVSASILRIDGDTGTLAGRFANGKFLLSHFSGARPALLEVTPNADGTLSLVQNGKTTYTAIKSSEARAKNLPAPSDPSRWTSLQDPTKPLQFTGKDLAGNTVTDKDSRFAGKVVLVNITGSWCPNCHDEAPFLAEIYRTYKSRGLEIVALSFEEAEQLADPTRLKAFIKNYGLEYTVLLAGETSERDTKLPQAVNLNTWPATFFIGRDGLVRGSHAGFASKATGAEHEHTKAEFKATIEKLLAENLRSSR